METILHMGRICVTINLYIFVLLIMHILITGGTGLIGTALIQKFQHAHFTVLTRQKSLPTKSNVRYINHVSEISKPVDIVINLAGAPLANKRWTAPYKKEIYTSRIQTTHQLNEWINTTPDKPKLIISGSAVGYYGATENSPEELDERNDAGEDFPAQLCQDWESEAFKAQALEIRVIVMRLGVVFSDQGGFLSKLKLPFKVGLGAIMGQGKQHLSWVHIDDVLNAIEFFIQNEKLEGAFNLTAPFPVTNEAFSKTFAEHFHRPCLFKAPRFFLSTFVGELADHLILKGQNIKPTRLSEAGFQFKYDHLTKALESLDL